MFGSLMMFASAVLANAPSSANASGCRCSTVSRSGNWAKIRPANEISRVSTRTPAEIEAANANFLGGDILTGANTPLQTLLRPGASANPYRTGIPGVFICSAATPPGAGAHGINGFNAAEAVLKTL